MAESDRPAIDVASKKPWVAPEFRGIGRRPFVAPEVQAAQAALEAERELEAALEEAVEEVGEPIGLTTALDTSATVDPHNHHSSARTVSDGG